ncbi:hypothetical protein CPT_Mater61 [Bacillus phage Mater]|uniref:Uncharacterized protein n=1 Tax=Bacillus phage Mater TaxID=1540090 RepID=A0A0A0RUI0_9CAUD|nr:hypothetical protein CPT_Mater61 [Bacillus phage Mater]AIW03218.1 hypothetical protein CPT_Mater61 [Bacillus phage Mater]
MAILALAGSIGLVCAAGSATVAAIKFFNTWEPDFSNMGKKKEKPAGPSAASRERLDHIKRNRD